MLPPIARPPDSAQDRKGPLEAPQAEKNTFHLALTMAGTVSAAAYTAGVVDFLVEAMDAWEAAKANRPAEVPDHKLVLHAISGTSGGGITAAITAATLHSSFVPVSHPNATEVVAPPPPLNRLYDTWVRAIDMSKLLGTSDLDGGGKPQSLLNSDALDRIAGKVLDMTQIEGRRPWVSRDLHVFTTSANLRGVPYRIGFKGTTGIGYPMLAHFNFQHFLVRADALPRDSEGREQPRWLTRLDPALIGPGAATANGWRSLANAALATCAFPLGLKARYLAQEPGFYEAVQWPYPTEQGRIAFASVTPNWYVDLGRNGPAAPTAPVDFLNVDGGAINNEPFELARVALSGLGGRNPRDALAADRAVVMIDPLYRADEGPDPVNRDGTPIVVDGKPMRGRIARRNDPSLYSVFGSLAGMLVAHARFKPGDLALAADETVFSRFLVAPRAPARDGAYDKYAIFGELMGAFGAFFHEGLRDYDYRLGRYNAQAFLGQWFALPEKNALFDSWIDGGRSPLADQCCVKRNGVPVMIQEFRHGQPVGASQRLIPIIPLMPHLVPRVPLPDRGTLLHHLDFARHETGIRARLDALFRAVAREFVPQPGGSIWRRLWSWAPMWAANRGWGLVYRSFIAARLRALFETAKREACETVRLGTAPPATVQQPVPDGWRIAPRSEPEPRAPGA